MPGGHWHLIGYRAVPQWAVIKTCRKVFNVSRRAGGPQSELRKIAVGVLMAFFVAAFAKASVLPDLPMPAPTRTKVLAAFPTDPTDKRPEATGNRQEAKNMTSCSSNAQLSHTLVDIYCACVRVCLPCLSGTAAPQRPNKYCQRWLAVVRIRDRQQYSVSPR
jgi:hypothetical protein